MKKTEKKGRTRRESVADEVEEEGEGKRSRVWLIVLYQGYFHRHAIVI